MLLKRIEIQVALLTEPAFLELAIRVLQIKKESILTLIIMTLLTQFKTATATAGITYPSNNVEYAATALQVILC